MNHTQTKTHHSQRLLRLLVTGIVVCCAVTATAVVIAFSSSIQTLQTSAKVVIGY